MFQWKRENFNFKAIYRYLNAFFIWFNTYICMSREGWLNYYNSFFKNGTTFDPQNISYIISAYVYFFERNLSYFVTHNSRYYYNNRDVGKKHICLLYMVLMSYLLIPLFVIR